MIAIDSHGQDTSGDPNFFQRPDGDSLASQAEINDCRSDSCDKICMSSAVRGER